MNENFHEIKYLPNALHFRCKANLNNSDSLLFHYYDCTSLLHVINTHNNIIKNYLQRVRHSLIKDKTFFHFLPSTITRKTSYHVQLLPETVQPHMRKGNTEKCENRISSSTLNNGDPSAPMFLQMLPWDTVSYIRYLSLRNSCTLPYILVLCSIIVPTGFSFQTILDSTSPAVYFYPTNEQQPQATVRPETIVKTLRLHAEGEKEISLVLFGKRLATRQRSEKQGHVVKGSCYENTQCGKMGKNFDDIELLHWMELRTLCPQRAYREQIGCFWAIGNQHTSSVSVREEFQVHRAAFRGRNTSLASLCENLTHSRQSLEMNQKRSPPREWGVAVARWLGDHKRNVK